jgi:hypothetical protein
MKIIAYSTNINGYDSLKAAPKDKKAAYLYFTDGQAPSGWIPIEFNGGHKDSRFWKINSHFLPPHDISIYVDASYMIKKPLSGIAKYMKKAEWGACLHPRQDCIFDHAVSLVGWKKDEKDFLDHFHRRMSLLQYPPKNGLYENCIIVRRNTEAVRAVNELWWAEYCHNFTRRDQLTLPYVFWKLGFKPTILPFQSRDNEFLFTDMKHLK